jgi:hypothetical protein
MNGCREAYKVSLGRHVWDVGAGAIRLNPTEESRIVRPTVHGTMKNLTAVVLEATPQCPFRLIFPKEVLRNAHFGICVASPHCDGNPQFEDLYC